MSTGNQDDIKLTRMASRLMTFAGRMCEYGRIINLAATMYRADETSDSNRLKALDLQLTAILRAGKEAQEQELIIDNESLQVELEQVKALLESVRSGHSPYANDTPPPPRRGEATH